jgi:hypothetical protein
MASRVMWGSGPMTMVILALLDFSGMFSMAEARITAAEVAYWNTHALGVPQNGTTVS